MRLLRTDLASGLFISEFDSEQAPPYAILSHTWEDEEILFSDARENTHTHKAGYSKLVGACNQAQKDAYDYIWIDTCCVDKSSSAELSEAINSMWTYYREAGRCYAYLSDVAISEESASGEVPSQHAGAGISQARWFTRGWTLQELLAPKQVVFFDCKWRRLGTKCDLAQQIALITGIDVQFLQHYASLQSASVAKRMSWASRRQTRRPEDVAYSLMGLFSVNMPMLYGEGAKAFIRLQNAIMAQSDDQSLFAWKSGSKPFDQADDFHGLLANHPRCFAESGSIVPYPDMELRKPYSMTNRGLSIELHLSQTTKADRFTATLQCYIPGRADGFVAIELKKIPKTLDQYVRVSCNALGFRPTRGTAKMIYVKQDHSMSASNDHDAFSFQRFFVLGRRPEGVNYFPDVRMETAVPFRLSYDARKLSFSAHDTAQSEIKISENDSPRAFRIRMEAGVMTTALVLQAAPSELEPQPGIAILLGCITEEQVGFDVSEWPIPARTLKRMSRVQALQASFNPRPMGTTLVAGCWKVTVTTTERVENERKIYLLQISIVANGETPSGNDSIIGSLATKLLKKAKPQ